ncbi:MAG: hypothetical protein EAZ57_07325 [Cytophagales bacterium]|nr:MAG: hypothetical protein EAZ67_08135 [Cytophagales bacterium]TAF60512.1 MAG: hypothetical protein EAZ57_07325 [Cytophagales bacterium]
MSVYKTDRHFTDFVHLQVALPQIYQPLGWQPHQVSPHELEHYDRNHGIDYFFETPEGSVVSVQERFREQKYQHYNDFTLRYRRDFNRDVKQHPSEFFKIRANYMVYGIVNKPKINILQERNVSFLKYAVLDLAVFFGLFLEGRIKAKRGLDKSFVADGILVAPIKDNHDKSSSFLAFDVALLAQLFQDSRLIIKQQGFY